MRFPGGGFRLGKKLLLWKPIVIETNAELPCFLGHSLMYINSFINILKRLKKKHGISARIFAVDYRMVPEFTYPTPGEDCMAAYSYLVNDLSINPSRIIIGTY